MLLIFVILHLEKKFVDIHPIINARLVKNRNVVDGAGVGVLHADALHVILGTQNREHVIPGIEMLVVVSGQSGDDLISHGFQESGKWSPNSFRYSRRASPFWPRLERLMAVRMELLAATRRNLAESFSAVVMPSLTGGPNLAGSGHS